MKYGRNMRKMLAAAAFAASVLGMSAGSVFAADTTVTAPVSSSTWDRSQVGSITVHYAESSKTDNSEKIITGAEFTAYRIADVTMYGGTEINRRTQEIPVGSKLRSIIPGVRFDYEEDTADKKELEKSGDRNLNDYVVHVDTAAADYSDIVQSAYEKDPNLVNGFVTSGETDSKGNLTLNIPSADFGAYMVIETTPADGYEVSTPFVCAVPYTSDNGDTWVYQVKAEPKAVPKPLEPQESTPEKVTAVSNPSNPSNPTSVKETPGKGVSSKDTGDRYHTGILIGIVAACVAGLAADLTYMGKKKRKQAKGE